MASKFRVNAGFSQEDLDKLAKIFPEINDKEQFKSVTVIVQWLVDRIIKGELVDKEQFKETDIDDKIKKQKLLKLTLENWNLLKQIPANFEQKIALILLEKEMVQPELEFAKPKPVPVGLTELSYCHTCQHQHYGDEPRKCKALHCLCGVRG